MKKIIMFIAATAFAVVGYSAQVTWGTGNNWIKDKDGNNLAMNTDVYLIMASDASAVSTAITSGNSWSTYVLDTAKTSNTKGAVTSHEITSSKLTAGTSYNLAAVVLVGTDYVISGAQSFTAYTAGVDEASEASFGSAQGSAPISAWAPQSGGGGSGGGVPEPTSALLLVLGGAMLALRRKQK